MPTRLVLRRRGADTGSDHLRGVSAGSPSPSSFWNWSRGDVTKDRLPLEGRSEGLPRMQTGGPARSFPEIKHGGEQPAWSEGHARHGVRP
eukprot:3941432-Rhodomonas_salina.6